MMKKYLVQTLSFIRLINHRKIHNNLSIIRVLIYIYIQWNSFEHYFNSFNSENSGFHVHKK